MKINIRLFAVGLILLGCFTAPATASHPPCPPCHSWNGSSCESNCGSGEICCDDKCCSGTCCDGDVCREECCDDSDCGSCENCMAGRCECHTTISYIDLSISGETCIGCDVTFTAHISEGGNCNCIDWSGGGTPSSQNGGCSFTTKWNSPGIQKTVTATVTAPGCGSTKQRQIDVVKVDKIKIDTMWDVVNVTGQAIVVLKGTKYIFTAHPNPSSASWPEGSPVWSGTANIVDADNNWVITKFDSVGIVTLTAKCGCSDSGKTVTIKVIKPEVDKINYTQLFEIFEDSYKIKDVNSPQYTRSPLVNDPVCWNAGYLVGAEVSLWCSESLTFDTLVELHAETSAGFGNWVSELALVKTFPSPYICCAGETTMVEDYVKWQDYDAQWKYKASGSAGTVGWLETTLQQNCRYYLVLGIPQAPQEEPWLEVLDIACSTDVAWGVEDMPQAMHRIWDDFYNDAGGVYDTYGGAPQYTANGKTSDFDLTSWLSNYDGMGIGTVNCYDMAKSVVVFANALGCYADNTYVSNFGYLNCIEPIGCGWTNNPFYNHGPPISPFPIVDGNDGRPDGRYGFSNHAFARLDYIFDKDIYDASVGCVDIDSDPDDGPNYLPWYLDGLDTWIETYEGIVVDPEPIDYGYPSNPEDYDFGVE